MGLYSPKVKSKALEISANVSDNITFQCKFFGNPLPKIHWVHQASAVKVSLSIDKEEGTTTSRLQVFNVKWKDHGIVGCFAESILGTANNTGMLNVHSKFKLFLL